ncbi:hypothetical protein P4612_26605 [Priestia megaterium]|nr:hypothetical protein [Priestia megaterium]
MLFIYLIQNAQFPFLNTGSLVPSALMPSMSISAEPIMKSTWVMLSF